MLLSQDFCRVCQDNLNRFPRAGYALRRFIRSVRRIGCYKCVWEVILMKDLLRKKKLWYVLGSVLVVVLIFLISGTPAFVITTAAAKKLPIYCVQRDDDCVSLTFDAA